MHTAGYNDAYVLLVDAYITPDMQPIWGYGAVASVKLVLLSCLLLVLLSCSYACIVATFSRHLPAPGC